MLVTSQLKSMMEFMIVEFCISARSDPDVSCPNVRFTRKFHNMKPHFWRLPPLAEISTTDRTHARSSR